jgi:1-acyl-sn-glycerol-3-phosphate acyltransferase
MEAPAISKPVLMFFRKIARRYFRRHFHAVRVRDADRFVTAGADEAPLIVYANHGSWWDPMVSILLADTLMASRKHYAPMDAKALQRYGILRRVGIFPVEMKTTRGAVQFLKTGESIIRSGGVLWVTPQGQFVDARARPLEFKAGLATLAARVASGTGRLIVMPLAIEYTFWDERLPECLLGFGEPVHVSAGEDVDGLQKRLVAALEMTMDELKSKAVLRDASEFQELARGKSGAGGFYGLGQKLKTVVRRRPVRAERIPVAAPLGSSVEKGGNHSA